MSKQPEITHEEMLKIIKAKVDELGSQKKVAEYLEVSSAYLNDILSEKRAVSDAVAQKLGYRRVVKFRKEG
jgi:plasmid maintenance system antidote protein VapI